MYFSVKILGLIRINGSETKDLGTHRTLLKMMRQILFTKHEVLPFLLSGSREENTYSQFPIMGCQIGRTAVRAQVALPKMSFMHCTTRGTNFPSMASMARSSYRPCVLRPKQSITVYTSWPS